MSLTVESMTEAELDEAVCSAIDGNPDCRTLLWQSIEEANAVAVGNKSLIDAATFRKNAAEAEAARIKERILFHLAARDLRTLPTAFGKFARCANGGHQPLRITVGADQLPPMFQRVKTEADLDRIRQALKEGEILDFVEVLDRGEHLRLSH